MWHIKSVTIYLVFFLGVLGLSNNSAKLWKQKTKEMRKKREKGKKGKFEMGWGMKRHMYPPPTQVHSHIASIGSASLTPSSPYKLPLSLSLSLSLSHTKSCHSFYDSRALPPPNVTAPPPIERTPQITNQTSADWFSPFQRQKAKAMALKLNPIPSQTHTKAQWFLPSSFALPQMASLRSPKFRMASTLRSGSKSVPSLTIPSLFLTNSIAFSHPFTSLIWFVPSSHKHSSFISIFLFFLFI